jgi:hypothetical protein
VVSSSPLQSRVAPDQINIHITHRKIEIKGGEETRTSPRGAFLGRCFLALDALLERLIFLALPSILLQSLCLFVCFFHSNDADQKEIERKARKHASGVRCWGKCVSLRHRHHPPPPSRRHLYKYAYIYAGIPKCVNIYATVIKDKGKTHGFKLVQLRVGFVRGFVRASL